MNFQKKDKNPTMTTYYFIDYENVKESGLAGCDQLNKDDRIIIFFTKNVLKIDMRVIANHGKASLEMLEVPAGKQSADMHIGSYLGYLVGKYSTEGNISDIEVVIVSKDTDYDNVMNFWMERFDIKVSRRLQISKDAPVQTKTAETQKTSTTKKAAQATKKAAPAPKKAQPAKTKKTASEDLQPAKEPETTTPTTATVAAPANPKPQEPELNEKSQINNQIQTLLSKAKFKSDVINQVASIVVKHSDEKNKKQQIYRAIISKFGQEKGLNIYNHIKKHI